MNFSNFICEKLFDGAFPPVENRKNTHFDRQLLCLCAKMAYKQQDQKSSEKKTKATKLKR